MNVVSLGGGVQSSTMCLMAVHGDLKPMPDAAIFADTRIEPKSVYEWLDWLEKQLPFPIYRVSAGNLAESATRVRTSKKGIKYAQSVIPAYIKAPDGRVGLMMRQCTTNHKIIPIQNKLRALCQPARKSAGKVLVRQWIGISSDEVTRMRISRVPWIENVYPLIDEWISRSRCIAWMEARGYPCPPRSACHGCPFHNDSEWRRMRDEEPEAFAAAIAFERDYQTTYEQIPTVLGRPYLHKSCKPLEEVDFDLKDDGQLNLFENDCTGVCGV